ncbi:2-oxoacid:acceptor oxidoreductase family protein [Methanolobus sediminis]|uniref:pyruvate synthase n=1 Tax=Methanolobus sediminis TaxID=3072978 RepID=A0AA51UJV4_9EURY|nr:2-oxoacid:acceptor oxidoreductase family protein [Methanolobus sediminis]WMW24750.1 2-oxoacid:acceptor oxidoreductase family protein [Methanolobus sediminis]
MLKLRFHGRGGQGAKVASRILGTAAFMEGCQVQDFPLYGAERRGAPISSFTRISREVIMERGVISDPDVIIVMDQTILSDPQAAPLSGLKKNGVVFINTPDSPAQLKAEYDIDGRVITQDITKIALDIVGSSIISTLAGAVASKIIGIGEDSLKNAVEKELSGIITDWKLLEKNIEAALYCFNSLETVDMKAIETDHKQSTVVTIPFEPASISSPSIKATANSLLKQTGNWRIYKPFWDYDVCNKCMICVSRCPEGCISLNEQGFPSPDYDHCKGCMICAEECPKKGIKAIMDSVPDKEEVTGE